MLNQVFLEDFREVRVVCGWGEGILKRIDEELARDPLVGGYRAEGPAFIVEIILRFNDGY